MPKVLILVGLSLVIIGLSLWLLPKVSGMHPLGKLPGDFHFKKEGFEFHFPLVTCLLISLILSLLFRFFGGR